MARIGKIARLPEPVRTELNKRLRDGESGVTILPWLNAVPEVVSVVTDQFGGKEVTAENLSAWRQGGFKEWESAQDRFHQTRLMAERSIDLAKASGGNLTEGAAAILAGQILEVFEGMGNLRDQLGQEQDADKVTATAEALKDLADAVVKLRAGDQDNVRLRQRDRDLDRKDAELRFNMRRVVETVLKAAHDARAQEIASSATDNATQLEMMGQHLFGDLWKPREEAAA